MSRYRTQGLLAVGLGLAAAACDAPDLNTNLRTEGPPDVLAVLTQNPIDWDGNTLTETAVKCRYVDGKRDPKAPGFVGDPITGGALICPETETEFMAQPAHLRNLEPRIIDGVPWGLRVMFDELLDADLAETLVTVDDEGNELPCGPLDETCQGSLNTTQPFSLKCGTDNTELAYTGYYVPNGNSVTFPLGPSLFLRPNADDLVFPTGSPCNLTLDPTRIHDKDGNPVPTTDLSFPLKIADLELIAIDPPEGADAVISPDPAAAGAAAFIFNANIAFDEDSGEVLDPEMFQLKDEAGADVATATFVGGYNAGDLTDAVYVFPATATGIFLPGDYTATMKAGEIAEINGGTLTVAADTSTHFAVAFAKTGQTSGTDFSPVGLIRVSFNNTIDPTSLDATDFEFFQTNPPTTPPSAPIAFTVAVGNTTSAALNNVANNALVFTPAAELPIGTYALRIKAGTELKDTAATPHTTTFSAPIALTYTVQLKATHSIPANAGMLLSTANFDAVFSGSLDFASIDVSDFTLVDMADMSAVPFAIEMATSTSRPAPAPPSHPNDTVRINPTANLVLGHTYVLTIKQGAAIKSANGVNRTFGAPPGTATNRTSWTFTAI